MERVLLLTRTPSRNKGERTRPMTNDYMNSTISDQSDKATVVRNIRSVSV